MGHLRGVAGNAGGGGAAISAGGQSQNTGTIIFSNGGGVTFGLNNGTLTASAQTANPSPVNISAGTTSNNLPAIVFSNLNGFSFGLNGSTVTGSHNGLTTAMASNAGSNFVQANAGFNGTGASGTIASNSISISVNTSYLGSNASTNYVQANAAFNGTNISGTIASNGLSLSVAAPGAGGGVALYDGANSITSGTARFTNANGVSFSFNGQTISASVAAQTNQSIGAYAVSNTTQSTSGTIDARSLSFQGRGIASVGISNGSVVISVPSAGASVNFSAGTTSNNLGAITFSDANNVSWGLNGSTITASVAGTTSVSVTGILSASTNGATVSLGVGPATAYAVSNTTQSTSGSFDLRSMSFAGAGGVSVGVSNGSVVISGGAGGGGAAISGGANSQSTGTVNFSASNGITFGLSNNGVMTASLALTSQSNQAFSAPGGSSAFQTLVFANSQGVSFSNSNGSLVGSVKTDYAGTGTSATNASITMNSNGLAISVAAPGGGGGIVLYDGANSITSGTARFTNANGVSFTFNGQTISGSVATTYLASNASTNYVQANAVFNGTGASGTIASNAISVSVPATSSLVGTLGMSVSTAGATISIRPQPFSRYFYPDHALTNVTAPGVGSMSIQYVLMPNNVSATRLDMLFNWSAGSSATTNTAAIALTIFGGIYTRNGATLSSLSSGSTQTTYTYASNSAGTGNSGTAVRAMSIPINIDMSAGEYYVAMGWSSAASSIGLSTTNLGQTQSVMGANQLQTALNWADWGASTNATLGLYSGMGVYSAALSTVPPTISLSAINQTGAALSQANIALVFRNV